MKKLLLSTAMALALVACSPGKPAIAPAKPELGSWGVDLTQMKAAVRPGDDFFRHVNGTWLDNMKIPDDRSGWGSFHILDQRSEERVKTIIEEAAKAGKPGSVEAKVGAAFEAFMNTQAIETAGLGAIKPTLDSIDAIKSVSELSAFFGKPMMPSPLGSYANLDEKNPSRFLLNITQDGLGLPDRDYYLEAKFADKKKAYRAYVEQMFTLAGIADASAQADKVMALEAAIAKAHWAAADRRDSLKTYNPTPVAALKDVAPGLDWSAMLNAQDAGSATDVNLNEKSAVAAIAKLVSARPLDEWKAWARLHTLRVHAQLLPKAIDDANFAFYGTTLRGQPQQRERWKRGVDFIEGTMGEAVGQVYVDKYFPASSKAAMETLVTNLKTAMRGRLTNLEWMSPETKEKALAKLDKFGTKIGYPDKFRSFDGLDISGKSLIEIAHASAAFENAWQMGKLTRPVDRSEWLMTPQTVNAYYWPNMNEIVFPAAILQAPFFDPAADPAVNYGAIGVVIGHEISHGFDDQGREYDGDGFLKSWWTDVDSKQFVERTKRLVEQYNAFEPFPGHKVNGQLTLGENIADLAGMLVAYDAYKLSLNGAQAPVIDGLSGDQRFFLAYAQVWQSKYRDDAAKERLATDPHSPSEFRVNGIVRNVDAWYAAFQVGEGDKLYLPPDQRVRLW